MTSATPAAATSTTPSTWTVEGESTYERRRYVIARCTCGHATAFQVHHRGEVLACERCGAELLLPLREPVKRADTDEEKAP